MNIGNYHFFEHENRALIYDFINNILYSPKNKEHYYQLQTILQDYSIGNLKDCNLLSKYSVFIENYTNEIKVFNSSEYINKILTVSSKITLMISQDCNLRCSYCYGDEGKFGSTGGFMTKEIAEETMRFFVNRAKPYGYKYMFITFLGGEPLMNFPLMKHIIEFNKKEFPDIAFSYTVTTNLTLLSKEMVDYLKNQDISILISLDGPREIHNKNRVFKNGKGSFDSVLKKINLLKSNQILFSIRATLSHEDFKDYEQVVSFFEKIGAQQIFISRLSNYDVTSKEFDINVEELERDIGIVNIFHDKTHKKILNGENPIYVPFMKMFERIHEANESLISCGLLKGSTAVSFDGFLYPCHRFVGIKGFVFGSIYDGVNPDSVKKVADNLDAVTTACAKCWAKYLCKRGCVRDIAKEGGMFIRYDDKFCELTKKSIEKALVTYFNIVKLRADYLKEFSHKEIEVYNIV